MKLSVEDRQYLKTVIERTMAMKPFEIIEERMNPSKVYESAVKPEDLEISTLSSQENRLVLPIHDDHWYLGKYKMHPNGSKFIGYNVFRKPLGVIEIEVFGGSKVRGEDLRSENFKDKQRQSYFFVYLEDRQIYQIYGEIKDLNKLNEWQKIGHSRIQEGENLYPKFLPFVYEFEEYLKTFRKMPSIFRDPVRVEKCLNEYIELKDLIADYLMVQFIFGVITKEELAILIAKSKELFALIDTFEKEWKSMNEEQISEYFRTKLSPAAKKLINPRKVDIAGELKRLEEGVDSRKARIISDLVEGYLVVGDVIAPSLLEMERRKDRYKDFEKQETEDDFIRLLKSAIKGTK